MGNAIPDAGSVNEKFLASTPVLAPKDPRRHATVSRASTTERCRIIINSSDNPQDLNEHTFQVNGRNYQIQFDKEVAVPPEVIECINNAVIDKSIPNTDEYGVTRGFTLRPTKRFPYQFVDAESSAIFKRWKQASLDYNKAVREAQLEAEAA